MGQRDIQTMFNVYGYLLPSAHEALAPKLDAAYKGRDEDDDTSDNLRSLSGG